MTEHLLLHPSWKEMFEGHHKGLGFSGNFPRLSTQEGLFLW